MATITTINAGDNISASRADINTNFANLNSDKIETSVLDTDTAMAANSDAKIPSQKAVKTYIDTQGGANASTTVRGIVEEATQAELTAGTQTGATGARLSLNPVHTASSSAGSADEGKLPRLNPSGRLDSSFLGVGKIEVDATEVTVGNTTTETTLFDVSIPGGTLSTNNAIRFRVYFSTFTERATETATFRLKYGATTVNAPVTATPNANFSGYRGWLEGYLIADGSTSAQKGVLSFEFVETEQESNGDAAVGIGKTVGHHSGTATEDSTLAKTLAVTLQWSGAHASTTATAEFWIVEKIA